ncbi:MAG: hypothetical protein JWP01_1893 [Myxococcales bacterium]|nr:hypothetical protein [Myxococcales bacterium]
MTELALIQPTYSEPPQAASSRVWLPFGLMDRMQYAAPRLSVASEVGSSDGWGTLGLIVHAQASLSCDCQLGFYGTFPLSLVLDDRPLPFVAAGGPSPRAPRESAFGTTELGMFAGGEKFNGSQSIYRIGALLPTAAREIEPRFASARVGDAVLELPRSAGVRISMSEITSWMNVPTRWLGPGIDVAFRYDLGFDTVQILGEGLHAIPRIAGGALFTRRVFTISLDTALSIPDPDGDSELRWSAGMTTSLARLDGSGSRLQPAFRIATVRTGDGWGATLSLELAATAKPRSRYDDFPERYGARSVTRSALAVAP